MIIVHLLVILVICVETYCIVCILPKDTLKNVICFPFKTLIFLLFLNIIIITVIVRVYLNFKVVAFLANLFIGVRDLLLFGLGWLFVRILGRRNLLLRFLQTDGNWAHHEIHLKYGGSFDSCGAPLSLRLNDVDGKTWRRLPVVVPVDDGVRAQDLKELILLDEFYSIDRLIKCRLVVWRLRVPPQHEFTFELLLLLEFLLLSR